MEVISCGLDLPRGTVLLLPELYEDGLGVVGDGLGDLEVRQGGLTEDLQG